MSTPQATGLTLADIEKFPDDGIKREILGGELFVSPKGTSHHQYVIGWAVKYPPPTIVEAGGVVAPPHLPGLCVAVDAVLGQAGADGS